MLHRAFTFLLATVLFWSALASQEHPLHLAQAHAAGAIAAASGHGDPQGGSVNEHHLDDLPGQHAVDHASDLPAWFPATRVRLHVGSPGQAHGRGSEPRIPTAAWDVPQRPPRA